VSSQFANIYCETPISQDGILGVAALINQVGTKIHITDNGWNLAPSDPRDERNIRQKPIEILLNHELSTKLESELIALRDELGDKQLSWLDRSYGFYIDNSTAFQDFPKNINLDESNHFRKIGISLNLTYDVFRLFTGFGTPHFSSERLSNNLVQQLELVVGKLGYLPRSEIGVVLLIPNDHILGHLSLWLMKHLGGILEVLTRTINASDALKSLTTWTASSEFPGNVYQLDIPSTDRDGQTSFTAHWLMDAECLESWLRHPNFKLY
jgi:hypothetical protein